MEMDTEYNPRKHAMPTFKFILNDMRNEFKELKIDDSLIKSEMVITKRVTFEEYYEIIRDELIKNIKNKLN